MEYKENYHPPDEAAEQPILPLVDEPEVEPDIAEEPPEAYQEETVYVSQNPGPNPLLLGLTIGLVFIVGVAIGFLGRPVLIKDLPIEVVVTVVPNESQAVAQANTTSANNEAISEAENSPSSQADQTNLANSDSAAPGGQPTPTIMDFVLSDARHFQGEEAAPVTIVEFSDFN